MELKFIELIFKLVSIIFLIMTQVQYKLDPNLH